RRSPTAPGHRAVAHLPPATVPALPTLLLPSRPWSTHLARPRLPGARPTACPSPGLLPAPLRVVPAPFQYRSLPVGPSRQPLYAARPHRGRASGGRGRPALPHRLLASVARPPRLRPFRHPPKLGGGRGGEKA